MESPHGVFAVEWYPGGSNAKPQRHARAEGDRPSGPVPFRNVLSGHSTLRRPTRALTMISARAMISSQRRASTNTPTPPRRRASSSMRMTKVCS